MTVNLTDAIDAYRREAHEILDRAGGSDLTGADATRFDELTGLIQRSQRELADQQHDRDLASIRNAANGNVQIIDGRTYEENPRTRHGHRDPWDISEVRTLGRDGHAVGSELRTRALDAIEGMRFADDKVRQAMTRLVETDDPVTARAANLVLATTSPAYSDAFIKLVRSRGSYATLNTEETRALERAMSTTDSAGGFAIPFQLDSSVILTASGSVNQVRQIARVVTTFTDSWAGVTSAGITGSWDSEAVEVSDDAPTLGQPVIPVHKYQAFVPLSHEIQQDAATLATDLTTMIAFDRDAKESIAHVTGSGAGQPTGIITALTGGSSVINSATTDTLALSDVYNIDGALPQRWAASASWLAHRKIYNKLRQMDTAGGNALWGQFAEGRKSELLGRPDYISEAMDDTLTALADNLVLLYGDFSNYLIVDRFGGSTLSFIPHLFGGDGRPTGQAGWHCWQRSGGNCVNPNAFRLLNVT